MPAARWLKLSLPAAGLLSALLACQSILPGAPSASQPTTGSTGCAGERSAKEELASAEAYAGQVFVPDRWTLTTEDYDHEKARVWITWLDNDERGVATLNYYIFDCGSA